MYINSFLLIVVTVFYLCNTLGLYTNQNYILYNFLIKDLLYFQNCFSKLRTIFCLLNHSGFV